MIAASCRRLCHCSKHGPGLVRWRMFALSQSLGTNSLRKLRQHLFAPLPASLPTSALAQANSIVCQALLRAKARVGCLPAFRFFLHAIVPERAAALLFFVFFDCSPTAGQPVTLSCYLTLALQTSSNRTHTYILLCRIAHTYPPSR
jgi:hypothetical protein